MMKYFIFKFNPKNTVFSIRAQRFTCLLVLLIFTPAFAGWQYITSNDEGRDFYISPDSIKTSGWNKRIVWELVNFSDESKLPYKSGIVQQEYDCSGHRVRTLMASTHSENFGKGNVLHRDNNPKTSWVDMPKISVAAEVRAYICSVPLNYKK